MYSFFQENKNTNLTFAFCVNAILNRSIVKSYKPSETLQMVAYHHKKVTTSSSEQVTKLKLENKERYLH